MNWGKLFAKIERSFIYITFFFGAVLLLSYLSPLVSPQLFWPLAFLGLSYLLLLFINLFFCVYWAIRLKKYFFIPAISILLGWSVLLNNIGFSRSPDISPVLSGFHLKLMTYNVHDFKTMDVPVNLPAYKQIVKLVGSTQPDIIGFEEFYSQYSRFRICDSLKKTLHTSQFYFEPFKITRYDSTGLALFSKYPIINKGIVRLSNERNDNQGIYIDIKYKSQIIRIYCFHLRSLELDPEDYQNLNNFSHKAKINLTGIAKVISKIKESFIVRGQQSELIRSTVSKCPYPFVLLGDLNDTPNSYALHELKMQNAFREKGTGFGTTFNGGFASFQIDYILLSQQFKVLNYSIIRKNISDHYPVSSNVTLTK